MRLHGANEVKTPASPVGVKVGVRVGSQEGCRVSGFGQGQVSESGSGLGLNLRGVKAAGGPRGRRCLKVGEALRRAKPQGEQGLEVGKTSKRARPWAGQGLEARSKGGQGLEAEGAWWWGGALPASRRDLGAGEAVKWARLWGEQDHGGRPQGGRSALEWVVRRGVGRVSRRACPRVEQVRASGQGFRGGWSDVLRRTGGASSWAAESSRCAGLEGACEMPREWVSPRVGPWGPRGLRGFTGISGEDLRWAGRRGPQGRGLVCGEGGRGYPEGGLKGLRGGWLATPRKYAAWKAAFDEETRDRPYGHCLVAGVSEYPKKVIRKDSAKKQAKISRMKAFIKLVNYNHIMPTRYTVDGDLKDIVNVDVLQARDKKVTAAKETKVVDLLDPNQKGGKIELFGGAGVGKKVLITELINNVAKAHGLLLVALGVKKNLHVLTFFQVI
ncbi:hypothetical protein KY290_000845 [Solanum tuberosum]|uniref:60S ribosomal protein L27 n=1 Tax=Solanum tuberosum TaxID=4113 RepID=A0ABQ7WMP3_SOLTU|nr:hypothetical protein KY289_000902 [Solanum tuberosum]KAH0781247.1 hypothetical protein KY290_000845 [Solanum tuberosum]